MAEGDKSIVLIVDDDEMVRKSLARDLGDSPYEILLAEDAKGALTVIKDKPVDIVISDLRMPGIHGLSLLHIIKDHYPDIIKIVLTGYADMDAVLGAINEIEVFRFFIKPVGGRELIPGLGQAMKVRQTRLAIKRLFADVEEQILNIRTIAPHIFFK